MVDSSGGNEMNDSGTRAYERPEWTNVVPDAPDVVLGADMFWYLTQAQEWVHRRVEQVRFLDDRTVERRVSIDFSLPSNDMPSFPRFIGGELASPQMQYVPLARLRKVPLVQFDLRDESGASLSTLTRRQNGLIAWSLLVAIAEQVAPHTNVSLPLHSTVIAELERVVFCSFDMAAGLVNEFTHTHNNADLRALMTDQTFRDTVSNLARNFLLIAPVEYRQSERRILKFSYQEQFEWPSYDWRMILPWQPVIFDFDAPSVDEAETYHFEVHAPPTLRIPVAAMFNAQGGATMSAADDPGGVAHLYVSDVTVGTEAEVYLSLMPASSGLLRISTGFALAVYALMAVLLARLEVVSSSGATALLLLVPGLLAGFIVRSGEHALATRIIFPFRLIVSLLGALPFIGALILVSGFHGWPLYWSWLLLTGLTGVLLFVIAKSYLAAR